MPRVILGDDFPGDPALLYWKYIVQDFVLNPNITWTDVGLTDDGTQEQALFVSNTSGHQVLVTGFGFPPDAGDPRDILPNTFVTGIAVVDELGDPILQVSDIAFTWEDLTDGPTLAGTIAAFHALGGTWIGSNGPDTLYGAASDDSLAGLDGNDTLIGNAGNDNLLGGRGVDTMIGGAGDDNYTVDDVRDIVREAPNGGDDLVLATVSYTLPANVEQLGLDGSSDINATGNALVNVLTGNAGNNVLNGGAGADRMIGKAGDDTYIVDNSRDTVVEQPAEGLDTVRSTASFVLPANVENLTLLGAGAINGTGNELDNILEGNSGANVLDGGPGADHMSGGSGNDTYIVDSAADQVSEALNGGIDLIKSAVSYVLGPNQENLTLTGSDNLSATGNELRNVITGNSGNNLLDGGGLADRMIGGLGDDIYVVDNIGDVVVEAANAGTDTVRSALSYVLGANLENLTLAGMANVNGTGNVLANQIQGNAGNNVLSGGSGDDSLDGGAGNDTLTGGPGNDHLAGGAGSDRFLFNTAPNANTNHDEIGDFELGVDQIVLDPAVFKGVGTSGQPMSAAAFHSGTEPIAADASDRILYATDTGNLYYDPDGSGVAAAIQFAHVTGHPALDASSFEVGKA